MWNVDVHLLAVSKSYNGRLCCYIWSHLTFWCHLDTHHHKYVLCYTTVFQSIHCLYKWQGKSVGLLTMKITLAIHKKYFHFL